MAHGDSQSVLRCELCNKPFDKQSTLKRHGYYCRTRQNGSTPRFRSCVSCAKGKTRCDSKRPTCSRCIAKGSECVYPASSRQAPESRIQKVDSASNRRKTLVLSPPATDVTAESSLRASSDIDEIIDGVLASSHLVSTNIVDGYVDAINEDMGLPSFLNLPEYQGSSPTPLSGWQPFEGQQTTSFYNLSIPAQVTSNTRSLILRPKAKNGREGIPRLILHTLKSYLRMMLLHNALPPFIHPRTISTDFDRGNTEPLTNCISLVHMIGTNVKGSRKLFWKNVRLECERLLEDHLKLSPWELLTAMQAVSIYTLIRIDEGATDENDFDSLLLAAVSAMSKQLGCYDLIRKSKVPDCAPSLDQEWEDWIFEESERRLCVIYRVVNLLVYFDPAAMCDLSSEFVIAPLPARKGLWEANDELTWHVENRRVSKPQPLFGLTKKGQVVKLTGIESGNMHSLPGYYALDISNAESAENWEEWCSGMDGLGGLVMLAASLIA